MSRLGISLLIPTMNRPNSLAETLASYMSGSVKPSQIIVVDQSTSTAIREENKSILLQYRNQANVRIEFLNRPSSTAARNVALQFSEGELLIFSDDDVSVPDMALANVSRIMQDDRIGLIAGLDKNTLEQKGKCHLLSYLVGTRSFRKRKQGHISKALLGRYPVVPSGTMVESEWAMGYFFVVRKSLLSQSGIKWDEKLLSYAYAEDLDFSSRYCDYVKGLGKRCVLTDQVIVDHRASKEYRIPSDKQLDMYVGHRLYLHHKLRKGSLLSISFVNHCMLLYFYLRKGNYRGMYSAIKTAKKHKSEIKKGDFSCFGF